VKRRAINDKRQQKLFEWSKNMVFKLKKERDEFQFAILTLGSKK